MACAVKIATEAQLVGSSENREERRSAKNVRQPLKPTAIFTRFAEVVRTKNMQSVLGTDSGFAGFGVEDGRVGLFEEGGVERADGFVGVFFFDHEAHVDFAGALRDHAHVDVLDRAKDLRRHAALSANVFANQADEGLFTFVFHIGKLAQIGSNQGQLVIGVDGERDGDFAG